MPSYKLTTDEEKLIEKYQISNDEDIALYFFNKLGKEVLNIIYSKINIRFSSIPFEKEDLTSFVWKSLKTGLKLFNKEKENFWNVWINNSFFVVIKEIKKYFKNTELILNFADSWENYESKHLILNTARNSVEMPKQSFRDILNPIIEYVASHNKTYSLADIKKLLYLKSFGYSEREIAIKMNVSRRYITSMVKLVLKLSKHFLNTSNR